MKRTSWKTFRITFGNYRNDSTWPVVTVHRADKKRCAAAKKTDRFVRPDVITLKGRSIDEALRQHDRDRTKDHPGMLTSGKHPCARCFKLEDRAGYVQASERRYGSAR